MGASGKWLKSLITLKKPNASNQARQNDKAGDRHKTKWRLWRSSSEGTKRGHALASKASDSSSDAFNVVIATVVRATPKDFMVIKRERAAIRIQTVFRGFLARQALRALKAVVRLQAIFRGRQVRKQAAVTLRCMQALVRVQARVRTRCVVTFPEELAMQKLMEEHRHFADPLKQAERGWCDSPGTVDEVRAKLQMRQEGALKRERAIAYSRSQQPARLTSSPRSRTNKPMTSPKYHRQNENISSYSWLERWMAAKPWESRLMTDPPELTPCRKRDDQVLSFHSSYSDHDSVKGRRNNGRTRISARPFSVGQVSSSSSAPSSESLYDESRASTSSTSASPSLVSSNTLSTTETGERNLQTPSYHNLTASTKAKHRTCKNLSESMEKHFKEDFLCHKKPMVISTGDARSSAGSSSSVNFTKDLYAAIALAGHGRVR